MNRCILFSLIFAFFLLSGCNQPNWNRLKSSETVSIIYYQSNLRLVEFKPHDYQSPSYAQVDFTASEPKNKHINKFKFMISPILKKALLLADSHLIKSPIITQIDLRDIDATQAIHDKHPVDILLKISNIFGYIQSNASDTSSSKQLALKMILEFSDSQGFIGSRVYFITSAEKSMVDFSI